MRTRLWLLLVAPVVALGTAPCRAEWGNDLGDAGPALVESVRADLGAIVRASSQDREALVRAFVAARGASTIEASKRFRNPELRSLFHALALHDDWRVVHRALAALERMEAGAAFPRAFALLDDPRPRLREKAAITCLVLWSVAGPLVPADATTTIERRLVLEGEPHVRACLEALLARGRGRLVPECVAAEVRGTGPDGLVSTPFLHRMSTAPVVAPDHERTPIARLGEGAAADGPVAARFATPMLGFGKEDVPAGRRLRRFGERRNEGKTVHTGTDVGALFEGAGVYAFADGLVKFVHTGGDMGTLLVIEHRVGERELECVVLMHLAGVVFVRAGERVTAGELLGSLGTGFSFENGGHYPHLHVGIYPGAFSPSHNYGYRAAADGLADWLDPEFEIADRIDRTRPPIDDFGPVAPVLAPVAALVREGEYRAALAALHDVIAHTKFEEASHGDAVRILDQLEQAAIHVAERAQMRRFHGFPRSARALLTKDAATLEGLPNAHVPSHIAREWAANPDFAAELAAEARFEAAVHEETRLLAAGDVAGARDLWSAFPRDAGAVSLRGRIQRRIDALPSAAR